MDINNSKFLELSLNSKVQDIVNITILVIKHFHCNEVLDESWVQIYQNKTLKFEQTIKESKN